VLQLPESNGLFIVKADQGDLFCGVYWDSIIYKISTNNISPIKISGKGQGPGEVIKPTEMFLFEKDSKLLVIENLGRWQAFDTRSGKFIKLISKYLPAMKWEKFDEYHLVGVLNNTEKMFQLVDLEGVTVKKWGKKYQINQEELWSRTFATAVGTDKTIYFQEGTNPEVWVYLDGEEEHTVWDLAIPKYYIEPPNEPFNLRKMGTNFKKIEKFRSSFTQLKDFQFFGNHYLVVIWDIKDPYECSLDIYDTRNRSLVVKDFIMPGPKLTIHGNNFLFLEQRDDMKNESGEKIILHSFEFK